MGKCRDSTFTDGCLIVSRDAPTGGNGGPPSAADIKENFECLPISAVSPTTRTLLPQLGASWTQATDRCFNLKPAGGASQQQVSGPGSKSPPPTLCLAGGKCTSMKAVCFRAECDAQQRVSVVVLGSAGAKPTKMPCPTGTSLNLGAKMMGRYTEGTVSCPDNAVMCRGLSCGPCNPPGGFCSFSDGRCHCWMEWTGPSCSTSLVPNTG